MTRGAAAIAFLESREGFGWIAILTFATLLACVAGYGFYQVSLDAYVANKTDEKGTAHWVAYTEPPLVMLERGWSVKAINAGDQVTVYIFAAKNGAPVGNLQKIVMADGKELTTGGPPAGEPPAPAAR